MMVRCCLSAQCPPPHHPEASAQAALPETQTAAVEALPALTSPSRHQCSRVAARQLWPVRAACVGAPLAALPASPYGDAAGQPLPLVGCVAMCLLRRPCEAVRVCCPRDVRGHVHVWPAAVRCQQWPAAARHEQLLNMLDICPCTQQQDEGRAAFVRRSLLLMPPPRDAARPVALEPAERPMPFCPPLAVRLRPFRIGRWLAKPGRGVFLVRPAGDTLQPVTGCKSHSKKA